jgi:hypothetical protein
MGFHDVQLRPDGAFETGPFWGFTAWKLALVGFYPITIPLWAPPPAHREQVDVNCGEV